MYDIFRQWLITFVFAAFIPAFAGKQMAEMFPKSNIIIILARRKLGYIKSLILRLSHWLSVLLHPMNEPGCTSCAIHFRSGSMLSSSLFSISALAAINSRISVKGGIFNDSLTFINSPSRVFLKTESTHSGEVINAGQESRMKTSLRTGRFSSIASNLLTTYTTKYVPNGLARHQRNIQIYPYLVAYIAARDNYSSHHSKTDRRAAFNHSLLNVKL